MNYKLLIINCSLLIAMFACNSAPKQQENITTPITNDSLPLSAIEFTHTNFNFGKIIEGEIVEHTYVFTNTGTNNLEL
ncbi:MAG: DUF1573 domain-containing protein, partial [Bacteroidales bacterium]|nr:DUF1573 domain-containing protein [Bacteroidales bacterium]